MIKIVPIKIRRVSVPNNACGGGSNSCNGCNGPR